MVNLNPTTIIIYFLTQTIIIILLLIWVRKQIKSIQPPTEKQIEEVIEKL